MRLLDFFRVRRDVPALAPGGYGPPDFVVPVATPRPVGRIEWAEVGPFLYGIDRAGRVYKVGCIGRV